MSRSGNRVGGRHDTGATNWRGERGWLGLIRVLGGRRVILMVGDGDEVELLLRFLVHCRTDRTKPYNVRFSPIVVRVRNGNVRQFPYTLGAVRVRKNRTVHPYRPERYGTVTIPTLEAALAQDFNRWKLEQSRSSLTISEFV